MVTKFGKMFLSLGLIALAPAAQATVVSGALTGGSAFAHGGTFVKLDPAAHPFTVGSDNFNTNNLYAFDEVQNFTLKHDLVANLGQTLIKAGTVISSQVVFFDPLLKKTTAKGTVKFSSDVLAVISTQSALIASNYLGIPSVTYLDPLSVGLEPGIDFLKIGAPHPTDLKIVTLNSDSPGDMVRVITLGTAVPEPATWASLALGFGLLGGVVRWRGRPTLRLA